MARRSSVRGGNKLRRALRRLPKEIRADMGEVLEKSGKILVADMQRMAPKERGDLAKAAHYKLGNDKLSLHAGYSAKRAGFKRKWKKGGFVALFAEFGTRHHRAQSFIRPAFRGRIEWIKSEMRLSMNRMIARAKDFGK